MDDGPSEDGWSLSKEVLTEAIDRNHRKGWDEYAQTFDFTITTDAVVRVAAVENGREQTVELAGGTAVSCTCYSHREAAERDDCRHMRAVDAHPRL